MDLLYWEQIFGKIVLSGFSAAEVLLHGQLDFWPCSAINMRESKQEKTNMQTFLAGIKTSFPSRTKFPAAAAKKSSQVWK